MLKISEFNWNKILTHKLRTLTGRCTKPKTTLEDRKCLICNVKSVRGRDEKCVRRVYQRIEIRQYINRCFIVKIATSLTADSLADCFGKIYDKSSLEDEKHTLYDCVAHRLIRERYTELLETNNSI